MTLRLFNQRSQNSTNNCVGGAAWHLIAEPDEVTNELELFFRRQLQKEQELLPC